MTLVLLRRLLPVVLLGVAPLFSQVSVDPKHRGERILAVVPLVGAGTYVDPRRPLFAPGPKDERDPDGVQSFEWQPSDDGKYAVVEFVAMNRKAIESIAADSRVVKAFEKGKVKKDDVEKIEEVPEGLSVRFTGEGAAMKLRTFLPFLFAAVSLRILARRSLRII